MHLPEKATELTDNNKKSKMFFMVNFYIRQNGTPNNQFIKQKEKDLLQLIQKYNTNLRNNSGTN
jgi:hypothetical protein